MRLKLLCFILMVSVLLGLAAGISTAANNYWPLINGYYSTYKCWDAKMGDAPGFMSIEEVGEVGDGIPSYMFYLNMPGTNMSFEAAQIDGAIFVYSVNSEEEGYYEFDEPEKWFPSNPTRNYTWQIGYSTGTIVSVTDTVTTPAGTFTNCVKLKEAFGEGEYDYRWFAPNVGLVKVESWWNWWEDDTSTLKKSQVWEMTSYTKGDVQDETPPTTPVVFDDGEESYGNALHGRWSSTDPESGILDYSVAISSTPDEEGIIMGEEGWMNVGMSTDLTSPGLPLEDGATYYALVKARNTAGQWSDVGVSDGITVHLALDNDSLVPMQVGNYWQYDLTRDENGYEDYGQGYIKIKSSAVVSGVTRFDLDVLLSIGEMSKVTMGQTATGIYMYKDGSVTLSPPNQFIKLPVEIDSTWTAKDSYGTYTRTITSIDDFIEVPAGSFPNCVRIEDTSEEDPDETLIQWFAPGVGLVKEINIYGSGDYYSESVKALSGYHILASAPDTTAPSKPVVTADSAVFAGVNASGSWTAVDQESDISKYQVAVSTTTTEAGILPDTEWQDFGTETSGDLGQLPLQMGTKYYILVKATNDAGLTSAIGASAAFTVEKEVGYVVITSQSPDEPITVPANGKLQFSAVVYDIEEIAMPGKKVTWSVESAEGCTISSTGLLTASKLVDNMVRVTATVNDTEISADVDLSVVPGPAAKIAIDPLTAEVRCAETQDYSAEVQDTYGNPIYEAEVAWSVSNAKVGEFNEVATFKAGTYPAKYTNGIIATSGKVKGYATVTVVAPPPTYVKIFNKTTELTEVADITAGSKVTFTAKGYDADQRVIDGLKFTYIVENVEGNIGTISAATGAFTANKTAFGNGNIVAQAVINGEPVGELGTAAINIVPGAAAKIVIDPLTATVACAETQEYTAEVKDTYGNTIEDAEVTWSVNNIKVGAFTEGAIFEAGPNPGKYAGGIIATCGKIKGTATVTVIAPPPTTVRIFIKTVDITEDDTNLVVASKTVFTAKGYDALERQIAGLKFTFSVDNDALGIIGASTGAFTAGKVAGEGGFVTAQAIIDGEPAGEAGTAAITIIPGAPKKVIVSPSTLTLAAGEMVEEPYTATVFDAYNNEITGDNAAVTWIRVTAKSGTMTPDGMFTAGVVPGTYKNTIKATTVVGKVAGYGTVTVTAAPL